MMITEFAPPVDIATIWTCQQHAFVSVERIPQSSSLHPGVAVVVCTYLRAESLKRLLHSLAEQTLRPDQLIVVDASPDDSTEVMLRAFPNLAGLAAEVLYMRVEGSLRGLTRQRNLGAKFVKVDKLAYFDDDVVLLPTCLEEMARVHQEYGEAVAGVGGYIVNGRSTVSLRWRVRRWLRVVPSLEPGRYFRSGMSTPWGFLPPNEDLTQGDWLQGCATMWKTETVKSVGFRELFSGYAQGEDLDFSLRVRSCGKLVVTGKAHLLHLTDDQGRPDPYWLGYMAIYNRYLIHREIYPDMFSRLVFIYAWTMDTLFLLRGLLSPSAFRPTLAYLRGRLGAALDLTLNRKPGLC